MGALQVRVSPTSGHPPVRRLWAAEAFDLMLERMSRFQSQSAKGPVEFDIVDIKAAGTLIDRLGLLAAATVPAAPPEGRQQAKVLAVSKGLVRLIADGSAASGVRLDELAAAANYADAKHLRRGLTEPWIPQWGSQTIRLLSSNDSPVLVEHVTAEAVRVRRDSGYIAHDQVPGAPAVKPLFAFYAAGIDRYLCPWEIPFCTGTSYDYSHPDADAATISEAEDVLGEPLPGPVEEHLARGLEGRAGGMQGMADAALRSPEIFIAAGLDPAKVVNRSFSGYCVLEELPFGMPVRRGEDHGGCIYPGDEPHLLRLVEPHMHGVAACQPVQDPDRLLRAAKEVQLAPELAAQLGLPYSSWDTKILAVSSDCLLRVARNGVGARPTLWRVFGMSNTNPIAVALVEHAAGARWKSDCQHRARQDTGAGKLYPKTADFRRSLRAMSRVADAARVAAERQRRAGQ